MNSLAPPTLPPLCCPRCKEAIEIHADVECRSCHFQIKAIDQGIAYDYAALLQAMAPDRYRLYRALCNNGFISYHELADGSVSLATRSDVAEFGKFLADRVPESASVLDVGC